ncbi:hypothetical protein ACI6Q2_01675 [Chitinophagaceae bacterium LWZ2-11]
MQPEKVISGKNSIELWDVINKDFASIERLNDYYVLLEQGSIKTTLRIEAGLGGNEEGGYELTTFSTPLYRVSDFRFSIHPQDIFNKIGKIFGLEDIVIGYPAFDDAVIVKANDEQLVKKIFASESVRSVLQPLSGFKFGIVEQDKKEGEGDKLELIIEDAITDAGLLHRLYDAFITVLTTLEK